MAEEGNDKVETFSKDYVQRLNNEAAATRKALEEVQAKLKSYDDEKAAADEKAALARGEHERLLAEQKAEIEKERRSTAQKLATAKKSVLAEAIKARLPDLADPDYIKLFDSSNVKIDDEFRIEGLDEAVTSFREAKPHVFKEGGTTEVKSDDELARKRAGKSPGGNGSGGGNGKFFDAMNATAEQVKEYLDNLGVNA